MINVVLDTNCLIASFSKNAHFVVSNDAHFKVLETIPFPKLNVIDIATFSTLLKRYDFCNRDSSKEWVANEDVMPYPSLSK